MMPISEIRIGDVYKNPLHSDGVEFVVVDINHEEKMIEVQPVSSQSRDVEAIGKPFWKSNRDRMFSEGWRVLRGEAASDAHIPVDEREDYWPPKDRQQ